MPGFSVAGTSGPVGDGPSSDIVPYYNYTWEIPHIFGDNVSRNSSLIYAKDVTMPGYTFSKEEVEGASLTYKYASQLVWDDVRITYYDIRADERLCDFLKKWRERIWTPASGLQYSESSQGGSPSQGSVGGYKRNTQITNFTPSSDGSSAVVWTLHGSWPQSVRNGDLTYTDSDVKLVEIVVVYDYAEEECES
jgi:hypothetical protein